MVEGTGADETGQQRVFHQRAVFVVEPKNGMGRDPQVWRKSRSCTVRPSTHAPPACGFALADQGADTRLIQDYLGHRNIQHTVIYTATNPARFEKLWR